MTSLNLESLIEYFLNNLAFVSLLTMTIWYWTKLIFSFRLTVIGTVGVASANLSLSGLLGLRWIESGHFPLSNLYESLLFLAWGFTTFHLLLELVTKVQFIGVVTTPVALLITSFANFSLPKEMQKATALIPALQSNWLMMHVSIMMMSYVALLAGSLLSIAFLVVHFYTRQKVRTDVGGVQRPPLRWPGVANEPLAIEGVQQYPLIYQGADTIVSKPGKDISRRSFLLTIHLQTQKCRQLRRPLTISAIEPLDLDFRF
jgi:hypothetical protein